MENNEKLLEFIKADWQAKKLNFELAIRSPFPVVVQIQNLPAPPQLPLPIAPHTEPVWPSPKRS
jgi:hypothetical protein